MRRLIVFALVVGSVLATARPAPAQPKEAVGYWKFAEVVRVEYPVEKVHKLYPVTFTFEGAKLTAVAKALNGNNPKVVHTEEHQVWSWTAPPQVLVPGERFPMRFELKLDRPTFDRAVGFYIGGRINAGFQPPKPRDAAAYHVGADTRTEKGEPGGLDPRDPKQGGDKFAPSTYTRESFVVVPGRQNRFNAKEHPDQISFRVGGCVGNTREFNTIYEYRWVEGAPPADRGGAAGERPGDKAPAAGAGKWEYRVLDVPAEQAFGAALVQKLTDLGDEGWELVAALVPPAKDGPASVRLVFKRPKK
ncbi:MAG: DUF4177 domain-containing protein [Planctomycetes bacterium]|nr:DUF4177 domain-containing protein [Planctomycetota bacterium]